MKRIKGGFVASAMVLSIGLLVSCASENVGLNTEEPNYVAESEQKASSVGTDKTEISGEADSDKMAIEKILEMTDPSLQYEAAMTIYDEIKDDQTGNIKETMKLLEIMAKSQCEKSITLDGELAGKFDVLLNTWNGRYFIIPVEKNDFWKTVGLANQFTMYDEEGNAILDYDNRDGSVEFYHCQNAPKGIKDYVHYNVPASEKRGSLSSILFDMRGNDNTKGSNQDFEFIYDESDQLTCIKWKAYPVKVDGNYESVRDQNGEVIILKNQYKTAQCDLTYQENGYLESVACSGYIYLVDKVVGYYPFESEALFTAAEKVKLEALSLEDGSCVLKATGEYHKELEDGTLLTSTKGNDYYDLKTLSSGKKRITNIYFRESLGNGTNIWRHMSFEFKTSGEVKRILELYPSAIIYTGKDAEDINWSDERTRDFLLEWMY